MRPSIYLPLHFFAFLDHFSDSLQSIITSYTKFCLEFAQKVALKVLLNWDWGHEGQSQTYKKLFPRRYRDGLLQGTEETKVSLPSWGSKVKCFIAENPDILIGDARNLQLTCNLQNSKLLRLYLVWLTLKKVRLKALQCQNFFGQRLLYWNFRTHR